MFNHEHFGFFKQDDSRPSEMKFHLLLKGQITQLRLTLVISLTVGLAGVIGVYVLSEVTGVRISQLTRDPAAITNSHFYIGILSNFGLLLWAATTAVCLFSAILINAENRRASWFLFASTFVSLLLTFDDALLFHEHLFPRLFQISEFDVYLAYGVFFTGYLLYFARQILMTDCLLLFLAFLFLGSSVIIDQFTGFSDYQTFAEDSLKFIGIVFWLAYFSHTAAEMIRAIKA